MNHFDYRAGPEGPELWCEDVRLAEIADAVGTPVYVYSSATLERHYRAFRDAFAPREVLIAYAVKANANLSILRLLAGLGAGADTVSEGEIRKALAAGVPPERILLSGVGKTDQELGFALDVGVAEINVESEPELDRLAAVAEAKEKRATIAIRVNPDVGAGGHAKISTGASHNKFGVSLAEAERLYAKAAVSPWLNPIGVACHIGSQITKLEPFGRAFAKMRGLVEKLRSRGIPVRRLDLGGGLGVPYFNAPEPPAPAEFAALVEQVVGDLDIELAFEPGRLLVANAGVLLARVVHVNVRPDGRRFVVLDAGMNDLIRPAMYEAYHDIRPVKDREGRAVQPYDVVGPVCETGDTFALDRALPDVKAGELVAFMTAGAYGATMSSEYNARPLVPEVLVSGDRFAVVRARPTYEEMLAREQIADWLQPAELQSKAAIPGRPR